MMSRGGGGGGRATVGRGSGNNKRRWVEFDARLLADVLPQDGIVGDLMPIGGDLRELVEILGPHVREQVKQELARQLRYVVALQLRLDHVVHVLDLRMLAQLEYLLECARFCLGVPLFEHVQPFAHNKSHR